MRPLVKILSLFVYVLSTEPVLVSEQFKIVL